MDMHIKRGDKILLRRNKDLLCQYGSYGKDSDMPRIRYGCNSTIKSHFGYFVVIKNVCTEDSFFTVEGDRLTYHYDMDLIERSAKKYDTIRPW